MALFNKLFFPTASSSSTSSSVKAASNSRTSSATFNCGDNNNKRQSYQSEHSKNYLSQFPFDGGQVRVLLYRECDIQGRRLLFDSNALQKVPLKGANKNVSKSEKITRSQEKLTIASSQHLHLNLNGNKNRKEEAKKQQQPQTQPNRDQRNNKSNWNSFVEFNEEFGFKHIRPKTADIASIGEMIFGALAMTFRGVDFKVHWLQAPTRILCSQVFLIPIGNGQSPYTTKQQATSFATPNHSIASEYGSVDGMSMNSLSMPLRENVGRHMSETGSERSFLLTSPLDASDHKSLSTNSNYSGSCCMESSRRYSSTCSTGTDSGYSAMSRFGGGGASSGDQWSSSYPYSTLSSLGSVVSDRSAAQQRKLSTDSSNFPNSSAHSQRFSSESSLQRRISRNIRTSFENVDSMSDFIGFITDNYPSASSSDYCGNESRSNPEIGKRRDGTLKSVSRRAKLGLAVCISMSESFEEEMELFCSEHIALLESLLNRLRAATERAYINHKDFLQIMFHAWQQTRQWVQDLFTAPRIKCPVWLNITLSGSKYSKNVAERFIKELCWLLSLADTKDTKFFMSTMLTAVLTHHLGWVSTVSYLSNTSAFTSSKTAAAALEQRAKLLEVSQKHPYNALWAQMGDLYGALGMPPKLTRTIVYGTEKLSVERLLNVLTYFIRCGEVRRSPKRENFDKELMKSFIFQNKNKSQIYLNTSTMSDDDAYKTSQSSGLKRAQTCIQNLNRISDERSCSGEGDVDFPERDVISTLTKNEIPNVLAFRDSHFVQQELRIGNYLMDTGILKSSNRNQIKKKPPYGEEKILVTVTTPENVELPLEAGTETVGDGVLEAIELGPDVVDAANASSKPNNKKNFLWHIVPSVVKEGISWHDLEKLQNGAKLINRKLDQCSLSYSQQHRDSDDAIESVNKQFNDHMSHFSLSDLITQNSMGKSNRMTWRIEPIKEAISLEEQIHSDISPKPIESNHGKSQGNRKNVVFVLGDNEPLVNLRRSAEDLVTSADNRTSDSDKEALCSLHQCTQDLPSLAKEHNFGVKSNLNSKSKNLVVSNNEPFMLEKSKQQPKQQQQPGDGEHIMMDSFPSATVEDQTTSKSSDVCNNSVASVSCTICSNILNTYQTPSNATELEFEADEGCGYETVYHDSSNGLPPINSANSVDTLKSSNGCTEEQPLVSKAIDQESSLNAKSPTCSENSRKLQSHCGNISSVATNCETIHEMMQLFILPVPDTEELPPDDELRGDMKLQAGFIPSLFLNVNDHYVSDMVLQGTFASPKEWETNLREDLSLAAHSASLISQPVENVAIVADMENWDVSLISSHTQCFPYAGEQSAPVGMSQLVSSMLETVQAMNSSGISAYECLSFLESKLQEIYLHSETLAAFLLDVDFCPLSVVTMALNLSENDVPLLLSVATIHTPQISKKCGISFR